MKRVSIKPHWTIRFPDGRTLPPRLLDVLAQVQAAGSLSAACMQSGTSYRHAWDLIRQGEELFGASLLQKERGRGSNLTALGEKLVRADQRIQARLAPGLASLASELETEMEAVLQTEPVLLRVRASHGFAIDTLFDLLSAHGIVFERKYVGSLEAPAALRDGSCDVAGFHIPVGALELPALRHYRQWMDPARHVIIDMATRRQGLMVHAGNPLKVYELRDLLRPEVRFINRQRNSGTRFLLEGLMHDEGVDIDRVNGFEQGEVTHAAVAAFIASGLADAGFGLETAARRFKLDFIPLASERYFLMCDATSLDQPVMKEVVAIVGGAAFRDAVDALPGYDARNAGRVLRLAEAFDSLAVAAEAC
ncbi:MAG: substrate-binding domain-containing protein [Burkholderiaceae bacterium]